MNIVHIVGTGTIGEPLIGLLTRHRHELGIDEVTFHKNTPLKSDMTKVKQLIANGAKLATDASRYEDFIRLGVTPSFGGRDSAMKRASVVIDCTPKGVGMQNKMEYYSSFTLLSDKPRTFIAQGSESGFGKPFAYGINNQALDYSTSEGFIQVVSCNTHNICSLVKTFGDYLLEGRFVLLRRASDISQDDDFLPGVKVDKHSYGIFGTHHAMDANRVLASRSPAPGQRESKTPKLYSSSCVLPTQYMHVMHFSLKLDPVFTNLDQVIRCFRDNPLIAVTDKTSSNSVFSFGRDYGHYGRILNQTVLSLPSLQLCDSELTGFCFTPQDGNSLLSSVAATLWHLSKGDWDEVGEKMKCLSPYLFREI